MNLLGKNIDGQLRYQLWDQLRAQLRVELRDQLDGQLGVQLWKQLRGQLGGQLWEQLWSDQLWPMIDRIQERLNEQLVR